VIFPAPSKLYFLAAALFVVVVGIGISESGPEPRSAIGLLMAALMVSLGLKARRGRSI